MSSSKSAALAVVLSVLGLTKLAYGAPVGPAAKGLYEQCGGEGYIGTSECVEGATCREMNKYYSQCIPILVAETTPSPREDVETPGPESTPSPCTQWWDLPRETETSAPFQWKINLVTATRSSSAPALPNPTDVVTTKAATTLHRRAQQRTLVTTVTPREILPTQIPEVAFTKPHTCPISPPPARPPRLFYKGMNIGGFNLDIDASGSTTGASIHPPLTELGGSDGTMQMYHFVEDDGMNVFRLPVTWQYLTGGRGGGRLDEAAFLGYDRLVRWCLAVRASCIVDLHNFGRYEGKIIGQGGPTNEEFASLWGSIAARYARNGKVLFGLMNEPHDIPDPIAFFHTMQSAVTAIRKAGATSQPILLPSLDWSSASSFHTNVGGAPMLLNIKNPDGSSRGLVFDVHMFSKGEFAAAERGGDCPSTNASVTFLALTQFLRCHGRKALVTAVGGLSGAKNCLAHVCRVTEFVKANSDVYLGYLGWSAGSYDLSHPLGLAPTLWFNGWKDADMVKLCLK